MGIFKNKKTILALEITFFCLIAFFVGANNMSPFFGDLNFIDEGQFLAWTHQMLHGKLMFRDIYITYGPLFVYPLYTIFNFLTPSVFLLRIYLTLGLILGVIVLNLLMLDLKIKTVPRYLFNFLIILLPGLVLRQSVAFVAIYILFISISKNNRMLSAVGGSFVALTFLISPEIGIITSILYLVYFLLTIALEKNKLETFKLFAYSLLGLVIVFAVFTFWSFYEGWGLSFLQTTKQIFIDFAGVNTPNGKNLPNVLNSVPSNLLVISWVKFFFSKTLFIYLIFALNLYIFLALFIRLLVGKFLTEDKKLFIFCLFSFSFLYLFISRPDIGHLFFGLSPLLLILIYFLNKNLILLRVKNYKYRLLSFGVIIFIFIFFLRLLYMNNPTIKNMVNIPSAILKHQSNSLTAIGPIYISQNQNKYIKDLETYFNKNSSGKGDIFIFSDLPMLYFILDKQSPTRYIMPYLANLESSREKLLSEILTNKPEFILYDTKAYKVDDISNYIRHPKIRNYIDENYKLVRQVNSVNIYKRIN